MLLGPDGRPIATTQEGMSTDEIQSKADSEKAKQAYLEKMKKEGKTPIMFKGGPYDGMVYSGTILPHLNHFGSWDEEEEKLNGTVTQLMRHIYQVRVVDGKLTWVFERTEAGPAVVDKEMTKKRDRKRPKPRA